MSGHSKWTQIKRKKSATDEKRGRMFSKLIRAIEVAAREGGPSVEGNMTLASAVQKARDYSVPVDNIERAIKRAVGESGGARYEEVTYEGYAPGGRHSARGRGRSAEGPRGRRRSVCLGGVDDAAEGRRRGRQGQGRIGAQ